jgi:hypothetical protein
LDQRPDSDSLWAIYQTAWTIDQVLQKVFEPLGGPLLLAPVHMSQVASCNVGILHFIVPRVFLFARAGPGIVEVIG